MKCSEEEKNKNPNNCTVVSNLYPSPKAEEDPMSDPDPDLEPEDIEKRDKTEATAVSIRSKGLMIQVDGRRSRLMLILKMMIMIH